LDLEYRRLENEREELAAAYKESEAVRYWIILSIPISVRLWILNFLFSPKARKAEEQRAQRIAAEMNQYRHDMERRLTDKEEELESIK
jgi:hypothetical protein